MERTMESFVHLRKGRIPKRLHADLDGLKDDELGRDGFTGRTANIYRRHDPTAYRSAGPQCCPKSLANERTPGTCYLGDPQVVNNSPVGLARFCTLRSWLSQWSYDDANGDAVQCGPDIAVPNLVIGNLADDACTPSHTRRLFDSIGHPDKEMYEIPGANHYYSGPDQRGTLRQVVDICTDWLHRHGFSL
jgi:pimeloyl-ACP methyl ester carboxylesterase